ncbi:hypothetical protein [Amnibacterium kyonggiense]|uniref:DUF1453 domain-containing protein n=1 Tax=Amnibacterium kyonggiense TaxID=595671 RepID=A0A4R7FRX4_9MICO|nr:hypothetical protein [Amnibacterium kyonggiense]TDS80570.1 hypothetical protein CLV52_1136 [Amnibacterium kyonggiense]
MSLQPFAIAALALLVVALLVWRQLRWTRFDASRVLRLPVVLGALGLVEIATSTTVRLEAVDVAVLAAEVAVAVGIGAAMGARTVFRPSPTAPGAWEARTGAVGAALWLVIIAMRIGVSVAGPAIGVHAATSAGVSLLVLAAARGATALIARSRAPQAAPVSA